MTLRVVVAVGPHEQPFQRLLDEVPRIASVSDVELRVQYGVGRVPDSCALAARPFVSATDMSRWLGWANLSVTQASPGFVFGALERGVWPIVVGRQRSRREHVDDHQVQFAAVLARLGLATAVSEVEDLHDILSQEAAANMEERRVRVAAAWKASALRTKVFVEKFERTVLAVANGA